MSYELTLEEALQELSSAEDFLEFFNITYEPQVVQVNRLHILQRFHDYIAQQSDSPEEDETARRQRYAQGLQQAYDDFVHSDALTEKVFQVFRRQSAAFATVPVTAITRSYKKSELQ